ncbi:hypothetical protein DFH28DRAFT_1078013 [Melampsora americana]|nr:hypothetical protein DFH28DRAFT_1078013 [Melampsora americana]
MQSRLKFGTSAFHAYVHQWSCQLQYNPRLNAGWGFSDGEGLERNWFDISPLIAALRWASKQTRFDAIHLKVRHAKSASRKLNIAEKRLSEARGVLDELKSTAGLAIEYFAEQWERQKKCQSELMADDSFQNLQSRLGRLIDLEEEFKEAQRTLSEEEHATLRALPSTLVSLEDSITELAMDLGGDEFRDMPEVKDPQAQMRLRICVSKEKLYEAKVGKVEWQKKWDKPT